MNLKESILYILKNDVKPAVGCTEPVAIALASSAARSVLGGEIDKAIITLSPNVFKNGMSVGIPGIDEVGLDVAAALGIAKGDPSQGLNLLGDISDEMRQCAKNLLNGQKIKVVISDTTKKIYIESKLYVGNNISRAVTEDRHDNITGVYLNKKNVYGFSIEEVGTKQNGLDDSFFETPIIELIEEIEEIDFVELEYMLEGVKLNKNAVDIGLSKKLGVGTGYAIKRNIDKGLLSRDLPTLAMAMTSAAADARMSGLAIPVMSSNGSGNHGITAIVPIIAYNEMYPTSDEKIAKALAISHIITAYVKNFIGRLSPLCGCSIAAVTGSASGITWLMGGKEKEIQGVIKNILANLTGVVCDGAKAGCALKLGTAAVSGVQAALYAIDGYVIEGDSGIVGNTAEESIKNLGRLSQYGLNNTDKAIIDIMVNRT